MAVNAALGYRRAVAISAAATPIAGGPPDALLVTAAFTGAITVGGVAVALTTVAANTILPLSPEIVQTVTSGTIFGLYRDR
jgi:hypothetical protein